MDLDAAFAAAATSAALQRAETRLDELEAAAGEMSSAKRSCYVQRGLLLFQTDRETLKADIDRELVEVKEEVKRTKKAAAVARGAAAASALVTESRAGDGAAAAAAPST